MGLATAATPRLTPTRNTVGDGCLKEDELPRHDSPAAAHAAAAANEIMNSGRNPDRGIYYFLFIGGSSIISAQKPAGLRFEPLLMMVIFMIISYAATSGEPACLLATSCASAMTADSNVCL